MHTHGLLFYIAIILMLPVSAHAITPIDTSFEPVEGFSGSAGLGLNGQTGSSEERERYFSLLTRHVKGDRVALLIADHNYGETKDVRDKDDLFVHLRWIENDFFAQYVDWELFTQYEYDKFDDLKRRSLIGTGLRRRFIAEPWGFNLQASLGGGLFDEKEESKALGSENTNVRGNFYGKWHLKQSENAAIEFYGSLYLQPVLNKPSNLRASTSCGIKFVITKAVSLKLDYELEHDSEPFAEASRTDTEHALTINYDF